MKTICLIDRSNLKLHPPILALLDVLAGYHVVIVSGEYDESIVARYPSFCFFEVDHALPSNKILRNILFRRRCKRVLKEHYDIIWVCTGDTAVWIKDLLKNKEYVINLFELYDKHPIYLKILRPVVQNARKVIVPEYNRAHIFRVWFNLKETPVVIPNKFNDEKLSRRMNLDGINSKIPLEDKIIIYQGIASKERNLDALCEAIRQLNDFKLVLMCAESNYLRHLMRKYDFIIHQPFVTPPKHMAISSYAFIGVVTYEHYSLNTIFCAPNKIWEYASLGLPMLANSIPGLVSTIERFDAGVCVDMASVDEILDGIIRLSNNYEYYVRGANSLFESISINTIYKTFLNALENE